MRQIFIPSLVGLLLYGSGCTAPFQASRDFVFNQPWEEYERVAVGTRNGGITVRTAEISDVRISGRLHARGRTLEEAQRLVEELEVHARPAPGAAGALLIDVRYPQPLPRHGFGADLEIEVPKPCGVSAETGNGSVRIENARDVTIETSNGSVRLEDIDGSVEADTSNGAIHLERVSGPVHLDTSNGRIVVRDFSGDCVASTSNGSVELIAAAEMQGRIELRSSNGGLRISVPESLGADIRLRTGNGRLHVNLGRVALQHVETERNSFAAQMNGGGQDLVATTSNGSITLETR